MGCFGGILICPPEHPIIAILQETIELKIAAVLPKRSIAFNSSADEPCGIHFCQCQVKSVLAVRFA